MYTRSPAGGKRRNAWGARVVNDPFAIAAQLGALPDPFIVASLIDHSADIVSAPRASFAGSLSGRQSAVANFWTGEKFVGGMGPAFLNIPNYWELRTRSAQLFTENLYARGLIRRLVTNEINTGLMLEAEPIDDQLSLDEITAEAWTENVEQRFEIWGDTPALCDFERRRTFPQLQAETRREALVEGDVLVRLHVDRTTGLPSIQLIRGGRVRTPMGVEPGAGNKIIHGVEVDSRGREIAFHITDPLKLEPSQRIPAFGARTGRRMAWLVYGTDRRMDAVRGEPLLSLILQSLKELDRYRDSEQRAATINALLAMFIKKGEDKLGTRPFSGGATRNVTVQSTGPSQETREFNIAEQVPGVVYEELQQGEEPESFNTSRPNVNYGAFEASVINAIAWASEVPPEILTLAFSNNYSASKAAINEFKIYLLTIRKNFGEVFCSPIYVEWLVGEVLKNRIDAAGFLEARRNPNDYVVFGAWSHATWSGPVKPSVDLGKDVRAMTEAIEANMITVNRASKDLFGVRFATVLRRRKKELRAIRTMNDDLGISNDPEPPGTVAALAPGELAILAAQVAEVNREEEDGAHPRSTH